MKSNDNADKVIMKNKAVSFNIADDHQKEMYEYVQSKTNFSAYMKRLIYEDMKKNSFRGPEEGWDFIKRMY